MENISLQRQSVQWAVQLHMFQEMFRKDRGGQGQPAHGFARAWSLKNPQREKEGCDLRGRQATAKMQMWEHTDLSWDSGQVVWQKHSSTDVEKWNEQIGRREKGRQGRLVHSVIHPWTTKCYQYQLGWGFFCLWRKNKSQFSANFLCYSKRKWIHDVNYCSTHGYELF